MENSILPLPFEIIKIVRETTAEYTFRVKCKSEIKHGQFFMLSIPKIGEAPISVSGMSPEWVEFTIRKVGKLTEGLFQMEEGDTVFMRGPYGNSFPIDKFKNKDLVVIAGGTGLAAVRSTLDYFYENNQEINSVTLIVGFKDRDSILFEEDLEKFKDRFHTIYTLDSAEEEEEGFKSGFVTSYIKDVAFKSFNDYNIVIVGPPVMIKATANECIANGVEEDDIWVSMERKMSCGVGKCGHCKINDTYICLEGPVFNYKESKKLLD